MRVGHVACRQSPGLLERPGISDAEGYPVPVDKRPTEEEPLGWRLVVSPATDVEGWQYGSVFKCVTVTNYAGSGSSAEAAVLCRQLTTLAWILNEHIRIK